jgi:hypothetical protein
MFKDHTFVGYPFNTFHISPCILMAPGHIPAFLFATLIASFCYGEFKCYPVEHVLNLYQELPLRFLSDALE